MATNFSNNQFQDIIFGEKNVYNYIKNSSKTKFVKIWILTNDFNYNEEKKQTNDSLVDLSTQLCLWEPFTGNSTILDLLDEYYKQTKINMKVCFINDKIFIEKKNWLLDNCQNTILLINPTSIINRNIEFIKWLDKKTLAAYLILLCQSISIKDYKVLQTKISDTLADNHSLYTRYTKPFMKLTFPISTKEQFFNTLSNIIFNNLKYPIIQTDENLDFNLY